MKVLNLFGGPGAGKSTTSAEVFALMKREGLRVELVTEYAKDLTWEARSGALENQLYILAKQDHRLRRLTGQVDWIVTDSPLLLSLAYAEGGVFDRAWFKGTVVGAFNSYDNFNVQLLRDDRVAYERFGRSQELDEAHKLDMRIKKLMSDYSPPTRAWTFLGDDAAAKHIFEDVIEG